MPFLPDHFEIVSASQTATLVTLPFTASTVTLYNQGTGAIDFTFDGSTATYRGARLPSGAALTVDRQGQYGKVVSVSIICDTAATATVNVNAWP